MTETYGIDVKVLDVENHRKAVIPLEINIDNQLVLIYIINLYLSKII